MDRSDAKIVGAVLASLCLVMWLVLGAEWWPLQLVVWLGAVFFLSAGFIRKSPGEMR